MKATIARILVSLSLVATLLAQSSSPIKKVMDATKERFDAAEKSLEEQYNLFNSVHATAVSNADVVEV